MLLDPQAGQLLGEGLAVLGVGHGVHDGVQAAGGLGDEGGDLGNGYKLLKGTVTFTIDDDESTFE